MRADKLRSICRFDEAARIYENIVDESPEEAEAYWGLILCRYGIEYVDDPATGKKIPTCHRSSFKSVMEDDDLEQTLKYADAVARRVYEDSANQIEEIRRSIVEVSGKEESYDIFICYKETDEKGERTLDSELAQNIYDALTDKGYRVFFSRVSLEDKLGTEYEPYIFAALNSAKVMIVMGTDPAYFNAVWVKNEWSRFLELMSKNRGGRHIIPCYKNIRPESMPKEFYRLEAQDMGKIGAMQDLVRGVEKLLPKKAAERTAVAGPTVDSLLGNGNIHLKYEEWVEAAMDFNKVLEVDPRCGKAHLGKLLAELKLSRPEALENEDKPFDSLVNYKKAIDFGDSEQKLLLENAIKTINDRILEKERQYQEERRIARAARAKEIEENERRLAEEREEKKLRMYNAAVEAMERAVTWSDYQEAGKAFDEDEDLLSFRDSIERRDACFAASDRLYAQQQAEYEKLRAQEQAAAEKAILKIKSERRMFSAIGVLELLLAAGCFSLLFMKRLHPFTIAWTGKSFLSTLVFFSPTLLFGLAAGCIPSRLSKVLGVGVPVVLMLDNIVSIFKMKGMGFGEFLAAILFIAFSGAICCFMLLPGGVISKAFVQDSDGPVDKGKYIRGMVLAAVFIILSLILVAMCAGIFGIGAGL